MTNPKNPRPTVPTRRPLEPLSAEVEVAEAEAAVFEPEVALDPDEPVVVAALPPNVAEPPALELAVATAAVEERK